MADATAHEVAWHSVIACTVLRDCEPRQHSREASEGGTLLTLPAASIATSCLTITLTMSADLLMSPIDTCKFDGMGLSTRFRSFVSSRTNAVTS